MLGMSDDEKANDNPSKQEASMKHREMEVIEEVPKSLNQQLLSIYHDDDNVPNAG
jgi:hypothetical protein